MKALAVLAFAALTLWARHPATRRRQHPLLLALTWGAALYLVIHLLTH